MQNLPHPLETLAGCCWLPRIAAKTRGYLLGDMPFTYRLAFGSRIGVDGYFFRHFRLSRSKIIAAVRASPEDAQLAGWFLGRSAVTAESIATWNEFAPRLGAKGHPGHATFLAVKCFFYPKAIVHPVCSIFEAIVQDEDLSR
ncbi:MAG TPA: DUF5069 domain-containing protein [Lacunisphaera sp.]|jgi:hypothetical protein